MTNSSQAHILQRIRTGKPQLNVEHPVVPLFRVEGNTVDNFIKKLESFDGKILRFQNRLQAIDHLHRLLGDYKNMHIYSTLRDFPGSVDAEILKEDPHNAHIIYATVTESNLGVGETGSLWVTDESLGVGAAGSLALNLFILIKSDRIVDGLHEAYRLTDLRNHRYGSFFTGPSATADIEAVRVTGAQGPLTLTALIYD